MDYYGLMHKDVMMCVFTLNVDVVDAMQIDSAFQAYLPISVHDKASLTKWLKSRAIPATRLGIKSITDDTFRLMLQNYGLSLTDCYWIKPLNLDLEWDSINFYTNDFKATTVIDDLETIDLRGKTNFIPSASLNGDLQKKWILDKDKRILVKGNYGNTALQSVSEVLATAIYSKQVCIDFTNYSFAKITANGEDVLGCSCQNFTTESLEYVPAIDIVNSVKKMPDMSYYQLYIELCLKHDLLNIEQFMSDMLAVDFLIANTDRHLNNFGILRDTNTLKWVCPAPVFDSGNSLFYKSMIGRSLPKGEALINTEVTSFTKTMGKQLRLIKETDIHLDKLPSDDEYFAILNHDSSLPDFDKEQRIRLLHETSKLFDDFLNGAKLWQYDYFKVPKQLNSF